MRIRLDSIHVGLDSCMFGFANPMFDRVCYRRIPDLVGFEFVECRLSSDSRFEKDSNDECASYEDKICKRNANQPCVMI